MEQEIISLENREDWGLSGYVIKNREKLEWFTEKQKKAECSRRQIIPRPDGVICRTCVVLPLIVEDDVIGVASIQSDEESAWDDEEVAAFRTISSLLAIAIKNDELFRKVLVGQVRLRAVHKANTQIFETLNSDKALDVIVREVCGITDVFRARVILIDIRGNPRSIASIGFQDNLELEESVRSNGISKEVVRSKRPRFFHDTDMHKDKLHPEIIKQGVKAAACLPLITKGESIGVLWVHYKKTNNFSTSEIESLSLFSKQAAIAYANLFQMERLERLRTSVEGMAGAEGTPKVLEKIAKGACKVLGGDSAVIWWYDKARDQFIPELSFSYGISEQVWRKISSQEPSQGKTSRYILENGWLWVEDCDNISSDSAVGKSVIDLMTMIDSKSFQGIALKVGEEMLGVLFIDYKHSHSFEKNEIELARSFALHAAIALKNAIVLERLNNANSISRVVAEVTLLEDTKKTLDLILDEIKKTLKCDLITLYKFNRESCKFEMPPIITGNLKRRDRVIGGGDLPKDSAPYGILELDDPLWVTNNEKDSLLGTEFAKREKVVSSAGIPLIVKGEKVGVLFINFRHFYKPSEDKKKDINLFANQAAVAIRNEQLYSKQQTRLRALKALNSVGSKITGESNLQEILKIIAKSAWRITGYGGVRASYSKIALLENNQAIFSNTYPESELKKIVSVLGPWINLKDEPDRRIGITGQVIKSKNSILVQDVKDINNNHGYLESHPDTRSELDVPIILKGEVIGVIGVAHPNVGAFTMDDQRDLESIAAFASVAIENAKHNEKQLQHIKNLGTVYAASKFLTTNIADDLSSLLASILKQAVDRVVSIENVGTVLGVIYLYDKEKNSISLECIYPPDISKNSKYRKSRVLDRGMGKIGITGRAVLDQEIQLVNDAPLDQDYVPYHSSTLSELDVPLIGGDNKNKIFGVISIQANKKNAFDDENVFVMKLLAELAVIAIQNHIQYQKLLKSQGLIGTMKAGAWMGFVAGAWIHTIGQKAATIKVLCQNIRADLEANTPKMKIFESLRAIKDEINELSSIPRPPISSEESVESVLINELIRSRMLQYKKEVPSNINIKFSKKLGLRNDATVRASPEWLRRVLDILIQNCVSAVEFSAKKNISVRTKLVKGFVEIIVSDSGCGIPNEFIHLLFEKPIPKRKGEKGSGAGLFIAKFFIQNYDGTIGIKETSPLGTSIAISLPLETGKK